MTSGRTRARHRLVEGTGSVGSRLRQRRWDMLLMRFPDLSDMKVIDLGGTPEWWGRAPVRPQHVTVVNLSRGPGQPAPWIEEVEADACALPDAVHGAGHDLVLSNSLLEHVGGHARRRDFARTVDELAPRHWIQTPYRYFPLEPHWLFPGFQFLPLAVRAWVSQRWPLVHTPPADHRRAVESVLGTELVGLTAMRSYFPDSTILKERVLGLTKSLIAVRA